ncbi:MAG: hypothetical protein OXP68_12440 [Anaerolineaceae bacterium]|nr:hypothetical protein [Anaerolineaceae bacterium]MDE0329070.1 hypothetical protein [Anaerolineaceae bacterium]
MGERIFAADWRACQEEHLRAVVAAGDGRNEVTLVQLLREIGFDAERLTALGTVAAPVVEESPESLPNGGAETGSPRTTTREGRAETEDVPQADEPDMLDDSGLPQDDQDDAGDEGPDEDGDPAPAQLSLF